MAGDAVREAVDRFYFAHGAPCCAGCDWWQYLNSVAGECRASAPVAAAERFAMIGISGCSLSADAGHVITPRDHSCGQFRDSFDWSALPLAYQRRIGATAAAVSRAGGDGDG